MLISKEDLFCWMQQLEVTAEDEAASENVLDFGKHGADILNRLALVVRSEVDAVAGVDDSGDEDEYSALAIAWQTCDLEDFSDGVVTIPVTTTALGEDELSENEYVVKNMPLPRGLKRYNRLSFVNNDVAWDEDAPVVSAFLVDGRTEPLE